MNQWLFKVNSMLLYFEKCLFFYFVCTCIFVFLLYMNKKKMYGSSGGATEVRSVYLQLSSGDLITYDHKDNSTSPELKDNNSMKKSCILTVYQPFE